MCVCDLKYPKDWREEKRKHDRECAPLITKFSEKKKKKRKRGESPGKMMEL